MGIIYKITNPKGRIYIGQTTDFNTRIKYYKNLQCKNQKKLYRSLKKYGFDLHVVEIILENIKNEDLNNIETRYIQNYNCVKKGLNCAYYGDSPNRGRKASLVTRKKMSKARTGIKKFISEQGRENINKALREIYKSGKVKHGRLGKTFSEKSKMKMRIANSKPTGRRPSQKSIDALVKARKENPVRTHSLLQEDNILLIKNLLLERRLSAQKIADMFGVKRATIENIRYGTVWRNIGPDMKLLYCRKEYVRL